MQTFLTIPDGKIELDLKQRRALGELLTTVPCPAELGLARWAVFTLGAASYVNMLELGVICRILELDFDALLCAIGEGGGTST